MIRRVLKVVVPIDGAMHRVPAPGGARLLHVACDRPSQEILAWYEVEWPEGGDEAYRTTVRTLRVFTAGEPIDDDGYRYVGASTCGRKAFLLYEMRDPLRSADIR